MTDKTPYWSNYDTWECYKNGMYENRLEESIVSQCREILTDERLCYDAMKLAVDEYKVAARVKLTNKMFNPISWIGQATCNYMIGATARETVNAWLTMKREQQDVANAIARKVMQEYFDEVI